MRVLGLSLALAITLSFGGVSFAAVGTANSLKFTTPAATGSTNLDLGDVQYHTSIVKFLSCTGGVKPYRFSSTLATVLAGSNSSLQLDPSGLLAGITPVAGTSV